MSDDEGNEKEKEEEYEVEAIIGKRMQKDELQYHIKWVGYSMDDATWEPAANLSCADKIHEYEEDQRPKMSQERRAKQRDRDQEKENVRKLKSDHKLSAHRQNFDNDVRPQTFTGIVKIDDELHAIVKYSGEGDVELVPVKALKKKWPQILINFLEKKLVYLPDDDEDKVTKDQEADESESSGGSDDEREETTKPASSGDKGKRKAERPDDAESSDE